MKKTLSIFTTLILLLSVVVPLNFISAKSSDNIRYGDTIDIGPQLRAQESDEVYQAELEQKLKEQAANLNFDEEGTTADESTDSPFTFDGGSKYFLGYDALYGYYFKDFTLRSIGENIEVWVANDLSFVDSRPAHIVTQEQVDKLRDEFDNNIYQVDTEFFGTPDSHSGEGSLLTEWGYFPENYYVSIDGVERVIMLVDNIRDDNFYNPSYPFFIAGFYSSAYESYFDRNIINLDTNSWATRLENTFFGTTAHEFQHLIHADNDPLEENWINEGMSDFAEYLAGYGHPWGHVNFFLDHPENSLVQWDEHVTAPTGPETLADYGQAYLLQLYLNDQFGKEFIRALAMDQGQGITGVNNVLAQFGTGIDFTELFRRFTVALVVDSPEPENGIYNFSSIDLQVNFASAAQFAKDGAPAWGGDYLQLNKANKIQSIKFDGLEFLPTPWKTVNDPLGADNQVLWGNNGDEIDNRIILPVDLTNVATATLQFDNFIDIEEAWDFGLVQVSTDGGSTFTSLANENTRSDIVPEGYPAIAANLPGFTGYYADWAQESFDLTPFVGQNILLSFRFMTDWGYNDAGWFIDNIQIPEIGYYNDGTLEGLMSYDELKGNFVEYAVTFINEKSLGNGNNDQHYRVLSIDPFNVSEAEALLLKDFLSGGNNYMVIWYAPPEGTKGYVDYSYEITSKSDYKKEK